MLLINASPHAFSVDIEILVDKLLLIISFALIPVMQTTDINIPTNPNIQNKNQRLMKNIQREISLESL